MKTLQQALSTLDALDPLTDPTVGSRRLAEWERDALYRDASEFPPVLFAMQRYERAYVRYTPALREAASSFAALMRDARS